MPLVKQVRVLLYIFFPLAFIACLAAAQEDQPTTFQGFEGKIVSRVDFSGNHLIDLQAFRPLLAKLNGSSLRPGSLTPAGA